MTTVAGVDDSTAMASGDELLRFADEHALPMIGLRDFAQSSPVDLIFDQRVTVEGRRARITSFRENGTEYVCTLMGEASSNEVVSLDLVPAELVLSPSFSERLVIRLADARPGVKLQSSTIRAQIADPCSALRRILQGEGIRSVHVAAWWPPY